MAIQWLTTAPNPQTPATGFDAGQRGWKLHAVIADDKAKFGEIAGERALCGLLPSHGWGLDLFIEDKCSRCVNAVGRVTAQSIPARAGQRPKACAECGAKFGHVEGCSHVNDGMKRDALLAGKSIPVEGK